MACGLIAILIAAVGALAVLTSERVPQSPPADDGAAEGEEGLVDVVALNVVRRRAAYSCRLRLFGGGTLTARPVVITTGVTCRRLGVPAPAIRQKALTSPAAGSASRQEGRADIIPAGVGWLALRISRSIAAGSLAGAGGRCWSARGRPVA